MNTDLRPRRSTLPFDGLRVIDHSDSVASQFAARLLADHGATVALGSPLDAEDSPSPLAWHLNAGKCALPAGIAPPHVLIFSDPVEAAAASEDHPDAIVAVVTDFAAEGPYAGWTGSEVIHQALSGSMFYNGRSGRRPLFGAGERASYAAGLYAYIRIAGALYARLAQPTYDHCVRVNIHEAAASMEQNFSTQWAYSATIAQRGEQTRPKGRVRCKDGWMVFFAMENRLKELFLAFDAPELSTDPRFSTWPAFMENLDGACAELQTRASALTQEDLLEAAVRYKLVLSPVRTPQSLAHDSQLEARGFWRHAHDGSRNRLLLGPMWRPDSYEPGPSASIGSPDVDGAASSTPWDSVASTRDREQALPGRSESTPLPLDGVRVADFTTAWSGPLATRILGALGAEVIKVESATHMDAWRGPRSEPTHGASYPGGSPGVRPYNRNAWFNTQNRDKQSLAVNLKSESGREVATRLAHCSDIVLANFSPGTMDRLGLGFDDLVRANPNIVMVEMSGFGNSGPLREHRGYGQTMEAMSGISALIGYQDDLQPLGSGSAYLDPMGGLAGAASALTSLIHQRIAHAPQHVDVPQREAAMHWIGEIILDSIENEIERSPNGNHVAHASPHDAYPASGEDEWVSIAVFDDVQWRNLCTALGWHDWMDDPGMQTVAKRQDRSKEIDRALSVVTRSEPKHALAKRLQAAGVPAAPVQNGRDLFEDPQLRAGDWFVRRSQIDAGAHDYPGLPLQFSESNSSGHGAPLFGEHTRAILENILGYEEKQVQRMVEEGIAVCHGDDE